MRQPWIFLLINLMGIQMAMATPVVPYEVIKKFDQHIELRQYRHVLTASIKGDSVDKENKLFRSLFAYIDGQNDQQHRIEMTAPVWITMDLSQPTMFFILPQGYTLADVPKPINKAIAIHMIKEAKYMVITFSGRTTDAHFNSHRDVLFKFMRDRQILIDTTKVIKGMYNSPWTLPFFKRNEVLVKVS